MASLLLFESDADLRRRLLGFLATLPEMGPLGEADSAEALLAACHDAPWDVVVVDLLAPGEDALALVATLRGEYPRLPVVAVSFTLDVGELRRCVSLGVAGLLASEDLPDELAAAVQAVTAGERYVSRRVKATIDDRR